MIPATPDLPVTDGGDYRPQLPGTRLDCFEVYNWGTFHNKVFTLDVAKGNCLLTGNIGAGKSTLVDGITSLLCAPHKVTYNQAAGASRSERTLTTYALGQYGKVIDEATGLQRPEFLRRADGTLSAVLATFHRQDGSIATAGMALTFRESASTPNRTYFIAPLKLTISNHLIGHRDIKELRTALREAGAVLFDDNFASYQRQLCQLLHVSVGGLSVFAQTVSMKQVGNLTMFVRAHMLDACDMSSAIDAMLGHYHDLTAAHDKVVDARRQLEVLDRVHAEAERYERATLRIATSRELADAVSELVDEVRNELLTSVINETRSLLPEIEAQLSESERIVAAMNERQIQLQAQLLAEGGSQLAAAEHDLADAKRTATTVAAAHAELRTLSGKAGINPPGDISEFARFRQAITDASGEHTEDARRAEADRFAAYKTVQDAKDELADLDRELQHASTRASNIPTDMSDLRDAIGAALNIRRDDLPFVGELLKVSDPAWNAAVEKLVRPFAVSLLVADSHYRAVSRWIDSHPLGGKRLVYYHVNGDGRGEEPRATTIAAKLQVRPGTRFTGWLSSQLVTRFNHVCVDDVDGLERHARAITRSGLVRDGSRHEKDDRRHVSDRRFYVLGWDTASRRARLAELRPALITAAAEAQQRAQQQAARSQQLTDRGYALTALTERFSTPSEIDVPAAHAALRAAEKHRDELAASPQIAQIKTLLTELDSMLTRITEDLSDQQRYLWEQEARLEQAQKRRDAIPVVETNLSEPARFMWDELLTSVGGPPDEVEDCDTWERSLQTALRRRTQSSTATQERSGRDLVALMVEYATAWPQICTDISPRDAESRHRLGEIRQQLRDDDLPRWEQNFRELLERNAIQEIAVFNRRLETEAAKIGSRLTTINHALAGIDYRPGTLIRLDADPTNDQVIRQFRADLRDITAGVLGADDETYSEGRFLRVRELLDRFTGREGSANADQAWVEKVTDVRQWFTFAAAECTRDGGALVEHYTDSDGKSGGQKEKLAYTVLAASLAYQYGLADGDDAAFRFVMIDEAFGRGSDDSTKFALDLFTFLGMQLLVVTPLQKVHTIEPHVSSVGFVRSPDGRKSQLLTLSITEWRHARITGRIERATDTNAADSDASKASTPYAPQYEAAPEVFDGQ